MGGWFWLDHISSSLCFGDSHGCYKFFNHDTYEWSKGLFYVQSVSVFILYGSYCFYAFLDILRSMFLFCLALGCYHRLWFGMLEWKCTSATIVIGIPTGVKIFSWIGHFCTGAVELTVTVIW